MTTCTVNSYAMPCALLQNIMYTYLKNAGVSGKGKCSRDWLQVNVTHQARQAGWWNFETSETVATSKSLTYYMSTCHASVLFYPTEPVWLGMMPSLHIQECTQLH